MAAGRGGGAAGFAAAGLAVSSSAMIRRMEARISSIDGSCAFAGWLIAESPQNLARRRLNPRVRGESPRTLDIYSDRPKYGTAMRERNRSPVDTHISQCGGSEIPSTLA